MATTNNRLATRTSSTSQLAAPSPKPGSTLLALAQLALEKSKQAGGKAVSATGRAARAAGRAAKRLAPEKPADIAIEEAAAVASHASAHALHRTLGGAAVGVKGGLEVLALVLARLKSKSPRLLRGVRSSLRGTLHHALGAGLHHKWPLRRGGAAVQTSGTDEAPETGEAEIVDEGESSRTDF
jgi:hypothetical protein